MRWFLRRNAVAAFRTEVDTIRVSLGGPGCGQIPLANRPV